MKRVFATISTLFCALELIFSGLHAECGDVITNCNPLKCVFDEIEFGGELLYWKPCVANLDYAAQINDEDNSFSYLPVCQGWTPGFRLYVANAACLECWEVQGSYTRVTTDDKAWTSSINLDLYSTLGHSLLLNIDQLFNTAKGRYVSEYNAWDILFIAKEGCHGPYLTLLPHFGLGGLYLTQTMYSRLEAPAEQIRHYETNWDSALWGVGFKAGSDLLYDICDSVLLFGRGSVVLLACEARRGNNTQEVYQFCDGDRCIMVPGFHFMTGIGMTTSFCNHPVGLHAGWEFLTYYNIPNPRVFMGGGGLPQAALSTSPSTRTYGFQGFVFGGDIQF